jgi:hypothetical protein
MTAWGLARMKARRAEPRAIAGLRRLADVARIRPPGARSAAASSGRTMIPAVYFVAAARPIPTPARMKSTRRPRWRTPATPISASVAAVIAGMLLRATCE